MKKNSLIIVLCIANLISCNQSKNDPTELTGLIEVDTTSSESMVYNESSEGLSEIALDSINLKEFWTSKIVPIINNENVKSKNIFHFPLEGDWGIMMELNKPDSLWTENDFFDNYEVVFNKEVRDKLKIQNHNDVEVSVSNNGDIELLVGVGLVTLIDDFNDESGIIFRFRKIDDEWKLYVIQGVG